MSLKIKNPRVRMAPSPTGPLHIGTTRTALFNYLFAKKYQGKFILRIEDTDKERSELKYEKDILEGLEWLGIKWDEFYKQSERTKAYQPYLKKLLDSGQAYEDEIIWFKNPNKKIVFNDLVRGRVEFDSSVLGDFSIAKDLDTPLYNFAVVVDDYEMKISHVIRGEDHLSNTPKQILIQEALGLPTPEYAHLPLILGPDKSKLSKRHGTVSFKEYQKQGYLPEALVNFMALLGWNPGDEREIFSLEDLTKEFSVERIQKGGAIFNIDKLDWFNSHYIRQKSTVEMTELAKPYLIKKGLIKPDFDNKKLAKIIKLEQERIKKISEVGESTRFFFKESKYSPDLLKWKEMTKSDIKKSLEKSEKILSEMKEEDFETEKLKKILMSEIKEGDDRGQLLWPLRIALSGQKMSPGPFEIAEIFGKEETLKRIKKAQKLL